MSLLMKAIYLDHAASTPLRPEAAEAMRPFLAEAFGNPSAAYAAGREAFAAVALARRQVARALGALPEEIVFTSGGTEADNLAIKGAAMGAAAPAHMLVSAVEHPAVLESARFLERLGWRVDRVPVDAAGRVALRDLERAARPETRLLSLMAVNNEVGTLQPVAEAAAWAKGRGMLMHTDAVQAAGRLPVSVEAWGVDLLSLSGHKIGGPKGIGALYIRRGTPMTPLMHGGAQERGRRAGTEPVAAIVGFGLAVELAWAEQEAEAARLSRLRDRLCARLSERIPGFAWNGDPEHAGAPHILNVRITGLSAQRAIMALDLAGVCASAGSACSTGAAEASHVLLAMGLTAEEAHGSLRFSMGRTTTEEDVEAAVAALEAVVERMRAAQESHHS